LAKYKDVKEFEYPTRVTLTRALKGLWKEKISMLFHVLMAILLITGLAIDLLGVFLGGWLSSIRTVAHGYVGVALVIVFPIYLVKVIATRRMRMLMATVNYIDFALYALLILSGIAIASANQPWINTFPWLPSALGYFRQIAPTIHTVTTYAWLFISMLFPGGFLHGIATGYMILIYRGKEHEKAEG